MDSETLTNLVVRLTGDGSSYEAMMDRAQSSTTSAADNIESAANRAEGSIKNFANSAVAALAVLGAGALGKEALGNFQEAESIGIKLNAVLEANGRNVQALTADYTDFAVALEKSTVMEDDAILKLATMAETMRTTGEATKQAVKGAIAIAAVNDGAAESYIRFTAALARGDTETAMSMARMIPQLRGIKNETVFLAEAEKLLTVGMKAAEAEMKSSAGQLKVLRRDWGNMLEDFGKVVAVGLKPVVEWLAKGTAWLRGLSDEAKQNITIVAALVAGLVALGPAIAIVKLLLAPILAVVKALQLATVVAYGFQAAMVGLAAYGIWKVAEALFGAKAALKEYNDAMERSRAMSESLTAAFERQAQSTLASTPKTPESLNAGLKKAEAMLANYEEVLAKTKAISGEVGFGPFNEKVVSADDINAINAAAKAVDAAKKNVAAYKAELANLAAAKKSSAAYETLYAKIRDENHTIGMSALEKEIYLLKGVTLAERDHLTALRKNLEAQTLAAEKTKKMAEEARILSEDFATFGMEADKFFKLLQEGADITESVITPLDKFEKQVAKLEELFEGDFISGDVFGEAMTKAREEFVKGITGDLTTPLEKFTKKSAELQELFDSGLINENTFSKAMKKTQEEFVGIGAEAKKAEQAVGRFDSVLAGSAEALARVSAFREMASGAGTDGAKTPMQSYQAAKMGDDRNKEAELLKQAVDHLKKIAEKDALSLKPLGLKE